MSRERPPHPVTATRPGERASPRSLGPTSRSLPPGARAEPRESKTTTETARSTPWLAVVAGASLTALAYGALREPPRPARAPVSASASSDDTEPELPTPHDEPEQTPATTRQSAHEPEPGGPVALDAATPLEPTEAEPNAENDNVEPAPPTPGPMPTAQRTHPRPDAGAPRALPPGHPPLDELPAPDQPIPDDVPTSIVRHIEVTVISRWQQPGMCEKSGPASAARRTMMAHFRRVTWQPNAIVFVDPRIPASVGRELFKPLESAEREVQNQLALYPTRPDVFAYRDTRTLLAGGCTNDNVVAYYDGDLHVVPGHDDIQQSITHEYTHHALMSAGIVAPAWAQEGIAMNVARETWWQTRDWLDRVAAHPYSLDVMERSIPYTMTSEQSLAFYVQAAAMVWCATADDPDGLQGLVRRLGHNAGNTLDYEIPALADPAALRACEREILEAEHEP